MKRRLSPSVALLFLFWLVFFWPLLLGGRVLFFRDTTLFSVPILAYLTQFPAWRPPLWNALLTMGYPSFANATHSMFYPLRLLLYAGNFLRTYQVYIALHALVALAGMFGLVKSLTKDRAAACFAAVTFVFCGVFVSSLSCHTHCTTLAWLPAIFYFAECFCASKAWRHWLGFALCVALQILAGELYLAIFSGVFVAVYAVQRIGAGRHWALLALAYVLGVGITAVQLLPTFEFLNLSTRGAHFDWALATSWSTSPLRWLELVLPLFWGHLWPSEEWFWGARYWPTNFSQPFFLSIYLGVLPVVILLASPKPFSKRDARFWIIGGLVFVLLALGRWCPGYAAFRHLPLMGSFRYPEKFWWLASFSFSVAAAMQWRVLLDHRHRVTAVLGVLLLAAVLVSAWAYLNLQGPAALAVLRACFQTTAICGLGVLILLSVARRSASKAWLPWVWVLLAGVDLFVAHRPLLYTTAPEFFSSQPVWLDMFQADPHGRWYRDESLMAKGLLKSADRSALEAGMRVAVSSLRPDTGLLWNVRDVWGYDSVRLQQLQRLHDEIPLDRGLLRLGGVRWLLRGPGEPVPDEFQVLRRFENQNLVLWENPNALPRAKVFFQSECQPNAQQALQQASTEGFSVLERLVVSTCDAANSAGQNSSGAGVIQWQRDEPTRVELTVKTPRAGILLLNDADYPGWRVWVDDQPKTVLRANGLARAVELPAGEHRILWRFQPRALLWGICLSLASLLSAFLASGVFLWFLGQPRT